MYITVINIINFCDITIIIPVNIIDDPFKLRLATTCGDNE